MRTFDGLVQNRPWLLYDPADAEGAMSGVRTTEGRNDDDNRLRAKWLSTDGPECDQDVFFGPGGGM